MIRAEHPLRWPDGWPRTERRREGPFQAPVRRIYQHLIHQIRLIGGSDVVISSNMLTRRDGLPLAQQPRLDDPGVAVYWRDRSGRQMAVACDRWLHPAHNARAIGLSLEALRGIERWGATALMERAFRAFEALPAPDDWRATLGLPETAHVTREDVEAAFRRRARQMHPDAWGDPVAFRRLVDARLRALSAIGESQT